jgi:hypothetical protein
MMENGSQEPRRVEDHELDALVALLDGDDHNAAEEARWALEAHGDRPVDLLIERAPAFGRFGKLCAIELFEHIGDPRAATVLIPMLRDADETVRAWAASALADLPVPEAVEPLKAAYEAVKARGTPLDWSEPEAIRHALTALGQRTMVVPPLVAERARHVEPIGRAWSVADLLAVIEALADAQQCITSVTVFTRNAGAYGWHVDTEVEWPALDLSVPWPDLVARAREAALDVATHPRVPEDAYAILSWLDRGDT